MSALYHVMADDFADDFIIAWTDTGDGLEEARDATYQEDEHGLMWPTEPAFGDINDDSLGMYCMGYEL